jgi:hypothetical protein
MRAVEISDNESDNVFLFSLLEREGITFRDPPTTTNPYAFAQPRQRIIFVSEDDYDRAIRIVSDFLSGGRQG